MFFWRIWFARILPIGEFDLPPLQIYWPGIHFTGENTYLWMS